MMVMDFCQERPHRFTAYRGGMRLGCRWKFPGCGEAVEIENPSISEMEIPSRVRNGPSRRLNF